MFAILYPWGRSDCRQPAFSTPQTAVSVCLLLDPGLPTGLAPVRQETFLTPAGTDTL